MKLRKIAALVVVLVVINLLLGACDKTHTQPEDSVKTHNGIDVSKEVSLKMYLLGDKAKDFDLVYNEVNKKLKDLINATIDVEFLSWVEHDEKYPLLFASGAEFDLIFTASSWAHYEKTAIKNGFLSLSEEFRNTYAPDIMQIMPDEAWKHAEISGEVYMVPNYNIEYGFDVIGIRGDLAEKYGFGEIESLDELFQFFDAICENESDISPFVSQGAVPSYYYMFHKDGWALISGVLPYFIYEFSNPSNPQVTSLIETDAFREWAVLSKQLQEKGYWPKDVLTNTQVRTKGFVEGKSASMCWNLGSVVNAAAQMNREHPEWKVTFFDPAYDLPKYVNPYTNNGIAINSISRNSERALMTINELMTNREINELTGHGIEGVHWQSVGDDEYILLESTGRYPDISTGSWGWNNWNFRRTLFSDPPDPLVEKQKQHEDRWGELAISNHPYITFSFNEERVKNQVAELNLLINEFYYPIINGLVDNPEIAVDTYIKRAKQAGIDQVLAEMQRQADEWFETNK